ncbi:hypothetical protein CP980_31235 [Streptomyces vinaceus]|uniref:Uncharacterized protein n=1 Tax=Streptomyces vinaceus TaxID=1960 RepID=A0A5J6JMD9_STRVI|nr:hypothetical protein [Streptomyces vinaceus]QEV48956.1 hypothetical protein CP980_31235 [Streptomyces vinaceus]GHE38764.1 hypothetical protein GCM10017778_22710 [Streptomyces vinaceus]
MHTHTADGSIRSPRLSLWLRVREFAVPPSMIETSTTRRLAGDWAGACSAAGVDVEFRLGSAARTHGRELADRLRADLRHLAPDLLRWHMPRIAPDGLLRPGLTLTLARYGRAEGAGPLHLVARTPPAWADAGQRISLGLWDGSRDEPGARRHPHPRPDPRFRLDLHRHLWDARRADGLRARSGADLPPSDLHAEGFVPQGYRCATDRWAAEAALLLDAEGRSTRTVSVRLGSRRRLVLHLAQEGDGAVPPAMRISAAATVPGAPVPPVLPDAATWVLPDLDLLRTRSVEPGRLHPLVASALVPGHAPAGASRTPDPAGQPHLVDCRGSRHRIGLVDGVLSPLDHDRAEIRREELLAALTGTPLPCLRAIDTAHRRPDSLTGVRERLDHGDTAGALAVVESLLGPDALLRDGALRDELEAAARRRIAYGLFRADLTGPRPRPRPGDLLPGIRPPRQRPSHPRR